MTCQELYILPFLSHQPCKIRSLDFLYSSLTLFAPILAWLRIIVFYQVSTATFCQDQIVNCKSFSIKHLCNFSNRKTMLKSSIDSVISVLSVLYSIKNSSLKIFPN